MSAEDLLVTGIHSDFLLPLCTLYQCDVKLLLPARKSVTPFHSVLLRINFNSAFLSEMCLLQLGPESFFNLETYVFKMNPFREDVQQRLCSRFRV